MNKKMARRRTVTRRSGGGRFFARRSASRSSGSGSGNSEMIMTGLAAAAYGAFRPKVEQIIDPFTKNLPGGQYVDELALGTLGFFLAKGKIVNSPIARSVGKAMFIVECTRIGSGVGQGMTQNTTNAVAYNYNY